MNKKIVSYHNYTLEYLIENTYIAPFQRVGDEDHVNIIYEGISSYYNAFKEIFLPGVISLAIVENNNKMIILDGQHRISSLVKLCKDKEECLSCNIRVDLYHVKTYEEAREIYNIINSSKKVELYMGNMEPYIIPKIQKYFLDRFGKYCKNTANPRGLNINLETLAKKIQGYNLINKYNITLDNLDKWIDRIKYLNKFYSEQPLERLLEYGHKESLINELQDFYLGLYRNYEWIERLIEYENTPYENQSHYINEKYIKHERQNISRTLRQKVWIKTCGDKITGECFCCKEEITINNFDCGHIIPVKFGGGSNIDNLQAICRQCNLHMGAMNMIEYKNHFYP